MKLKRAISLLLVAAMISVMYACSSKQAQGGNKQINTPAKVSELTLWHAMGGVNGQAINAMVDSFNKSHSNIHVTAQFQGTYDDSLTKLKTAMQGKNGPDIVQVYDIGTRFMVDSGWVVPMQNLIDADKSFDIKTLEPNLLGYYTVDGKLYSMPFNSSTPILYYNKNAFKEAGLDPEKGPVNFKEVEQYAKALTKKDSSGKVTRYGYAMAIYGWFFEQFIVKQGQNYANNGNGREKAPT
ncbi:MAG TPA: ABC transporter substrate-binding protein, partial [Clostridiaceae bacterium]|nr:ABC transporter substrate-binding protein [Clostridiaceae bacterium]